MPNQEGPWREHASIVLGAIELGEGKTIIEFTYYLIFSPLIYIVHISVRLTHPPLEKKYHCKKTSYLGKNVFLPCHSSYVLKGVWPVDNEHNQTITMMITLVWAAPGWSTSTAVPVHSMDEEGGRDHAWLALAGCSILHPMPLSSAKNWRNKW